MKGTEGDVDCGCRARTPALPLLGRKSSGIFFWKWYESGTRIGNQYQVEHVTKRSSTTHQILDQHGPWAGQNRLLLIVMDLESSA